MRKPQFFGLTIITVANLLIASWFGLEAGGSVRRNYNNYASYPTVHYLDIQLWGSLWLEQQLSNLVLMALALGLAFPISATLCALCRVNENLANRWLKRWMLMDVAIIYTMSTLWLIEVFIRQYRLH